MFLERMPVTITLLGWSLWVFAVHTVAGQRRVAAPLVASGTEPFARGTLEVVWHACTWSLFLGLCSLGWHLLQPSPLLIRLFGLHVAGLAALFLWLGPKRLGSGFALPQWLLTGPLALALLGVGQAPARLAAVLLAAVALVHLGWALGIAWPSPSAEEMPRYVIGRPKGASNLPGRLATLLVTLVVGALAAGLWLELPVVPFIVAAVFGARGLFGLVERRLRPTIAKTPYARLSRLFYSPLCLLIAALAVSR